MVLQESAKKAARLQQELKRVVGEAAEAQQGLMLQSSNNKAPSVAESKTMLPALKLSLNWLA